MKNRSIAWVATTIVAASAATLIFTWSKDRHSQSVAVSSSANAAPLSSPALRSASATSAKEPIVTKKQTPVPHLSEPVVDKAVLIARLRACLTETDPDKVAQLEAELEALLTDANSAEILQLLPPDLLASPFAAAALRHWVNVDRRAAAGWVAIQTGLTEPEQTSVIYGWGAADKTALNDYLNQIPPGEWKQSAMKFAANDALAGGSPKDAIDLLVKMDRTSARDDLMNWSATAWAQTNSTAALQWANNLPDAAQRQAALGSVAVGLAWTDPQAATRLLAAQVLPGKVMDQSTMSVACVWSQSDPQSAANWVASLPAGQVQKNVLETVIQRWAAQDFGGATSWVNALPGGAVREQAAQSLAAADANLHREGGAQTASP